MLPENYALELYRGDTFRRQFRLWNDEAKTDPADLTDVEVEAEIRDRPCGTVIVPMPCTVTLPNIIDMELSAAACAALPLSKGVWDLQLTYLGGDVVTMFAGAVTVTADVTDSTHAPGARQVSHA